MGAPNLSPPPAPWSCWTAVPPFSPLRFRGFWTPVPPFPPPQPWGCWTPVSPLSLPGPWGCWTPVPPPWPWKCKKFPAQLHWQMAPPGGALTKPHGGKPGFPAWFPGGKYTQLSEPHGVQPTAPPETLSALQHLRQRLSVPPGSNGTHLMEGTTSGKIPSQIPSLKFLLLRAPAYVRPA